MTLEPGLLARRLVEAAAVGVLAMFAGAGCSENAPRQAPEQPFRVGLIATDVGAAQAAAMGAQLGAEEASHAAALFGRQFELVTDTADAATVASAAERMIREQGVTAIIGGFDAASCRALSETAERAGVVFLNVGCSRDETIPDPCRRYTFHVEASQAMYADARTQWAATGEAPGEAGEVRPAMWHHDLSRYGAAQLNDRFSERFGQPLDSHGWAGWIAVKILWEAALRAQTTDAAEIAGFLASDRAQFDGQKGRSLSFRPGDHQLRQPLYILKPSATAGTLPDRLEVAGEVPVGRPAPGQASSEFLDQLGSPEGRTPCPRPADPTDDSTN